MKTAVDASEGERVSVEWRGEYEEMVVRWRVGCCRE